MPIVKTELPFLQITFSTGGELHRTGVVFRYTKPTAGPINLCYKFKGSKQGTEFGPSAQLERERLLAVIQSTCQLGHQRHSMGLSPTA